MASNARTHTRTHTPYTRTHAHTHSYFPACNVSYTRKMKHSPRRADYVGRGALDSVHVCSQELLTQSDVLETREQTI